MGSGNEGMPGVVHFMIASESLINFFQIPGYEIIICNHISPIINDESFRIVLFPDHIEPLHEVIYFIVDRHIADTGTILGKGFRDIDPSFFQVAVFAVIFKQFIDPQAGIKKN